MNNDKTGYKKTEIRVANGEDVISISEFGSWSFARNRLEGHQIQTGEHMSCKGTLNIKHLDKYGVIHCHACGLRLKFPVDIKDGESMKKYFENI